MLQFAISFFLIFVHLFLFLLFGIKAGKVFKLNLVGLETMMVGFFIYFALFQVAYLPLLFLKAPFTYLLIIWVGVLILLIGFSFVWSRVDLVLTIKEIAKELLIGKKYLIILAFIGVSFSVLYHGMNVNLGWDASFYVGTINTTLLTDTMFIFRGDTGRLARTIDMRYALSGGFYMNTAVWSRLLNVHPLPIQIYTIGSIGIILHSMISFMIGKKIFNSDVNKSYMFMIALLVMNFMFITPFTSSSFLLHRSFESKSFAANVIFFAIFYVALSIWKCNVQDNKYWKILFIISLASVPISMTSLAILPFMVLVITISEAITNKDWKLLIKGGVSLVPNGVYLILFLLFLQEIWRINVTT